jgi:hypothetical protein
MHLINLNNLESPVMLKIIFLGLLLICELTYAQTAEKNYGIRYIQLGRDIREVWNDYDLEIRRQSPTQRAQSFGTNCDSDSGVYGNRKVMNCIFTNIDTIKGETHDLKFTTDNNVLIKIQYPDKMGEELKNVTSEEFVNISTEGLSKKYSQQPVVTSKPIKLNDNFDDETLEYAITCNKVLRAVTQSSSDFSSRCKRDLESADIDMSQLPMLSAKKNELLYNIKLAASKKGATCKNCNGTINTVQWGETGSNNVIKIIYTKRDLTNAYRFYTVTMLNELAINDLVNTQKNTLKNIESNVFKK